MRIVLLLGTKKGIFLAESDARRDEWEIRGPVTSGTWAMYDIAVDEASATIYAAGVSNWYGPAIWRSGDLGRTWTHSSEGLSYGGGGPEIARISNVTLKNGIVYAGVEPAGLFKSGDGGATWVHVSGPNEPRPGMTGEDVETVDSLDPVGMYRGTTTGRISWSVDGGGTWREMPARFPPIYSLTAILVK